MENWNSPARPCRCRSAVTTSPTPSCPISLPHISSSGETRPPAALRPRGWIFPRWSRSSASGRPIITPMNSSMPMMNGSTRLKPRCACFSPSAPTMTAPGRSTRMVASMASGSSPEALNRRGHQRQAQALMQDVLGVFVQAAATHTVRRCRTRCRLRGRTASALTTTSARRWLRSHRLAHPVCVASALRAVAPRSVTVNWVRRLRPAGRGLLRRRCGACGRRGARRCAAGSSCACATREARPPAWSITATSATTCGVRDARIFGISVNSPIMNTGMMNTPIRKPLLPTRGQELALRHQSDTPHHAVTPSAFRPCRC